MKTTSVPESYGMVTECDDNYVYVWAEYLRYKELRFPRRNIEFKPGEAVLFKQTQGVDHVQLAGSISKANRDDLNELAPTIENVGRWPRFKIKTTLVFPPPTYKPYFDLVHNATNCRGIGYSKDFGPIALIDNKRYNFVPGILYETNFRRIPREKDKNDIVGRLQTLFYTVGNDLKPISNPEMLKQITECAPWFDGDQISNATKGTGTSTLTSSNGNASWDQRSDAFSFGLDQNANELHHNGQYSVGSSIRSNSVATANIENTTTNSYANSYEINRTPTPSRQLIRDFGNQTFSRQDVFESDSDTVSAEPRDIPELDDTSNDGPWTGLVVCVNKTIVTIWSQVHGYVRADMELKESGQFSPSTYVTYYVIREQTHDQQHFYRYTAYDVKLHDESLLNIPRQSFSTQPLIQIQAFLKSGLNGKAGVIESGIDGFICAWDDWIGWVLCPKDQYILKHLQNNGLVEVLVLNSDFFHVKWIVFGVKERDGNEFKWRKMANLPMYVQEQVNVAFRDCPLSAPFAQQPSAEEEQGQNQTFQTFTGPDMTFLDQTIQGLKISSSNSTLESESQWSMVGDGQDRILTTTTNENHSIWSQDQYHF